MVTVKAIYSFPIKSCGSNKLTTCHIDEDGLVDDRRFVIVDKEGKFLTQRKYPEMARILPEIKDETLLLKFGPMTIQCPTHSQLEYENIQVWSSRLQGRQLCQETDQCLSSILKEPVQLIKFDEKSVRPKYLHKFDKTISLKFTDGYPVHIVNQASLDDLSKRLEQDLSVLRFRPNILIDGMTAYAEEKLDKIQIGEVEFQVVKPSGRCQIPNIHPEKGVPDTKVLETLGTYKRSGKSIQFGIYAYPLNTGRINSGEEMVIHSSH